MAKAFPYLRFFTSDWLGDASLRCCSAEVRGIWIDMLCIMHEANPYGHLVRGGKALSSKALARLVGEPEKIVTDAIAELESLGVFSRIDDGLIISRRMVRDRDTFDRMSSLGQKSAASRSNGGEHFRSNENSDSRSNGEEAFRSNGVDDSRCNGEDESRSNENDDPRSTALHARSGERDRDPVHSTHKPIAHSLETHSLAAHNQAESMSSLRDSIAPAGDFAAQNAPPAQKKPDKSVRQPRLDLDEIAAKREMLGVVWQRVQPHLGRAKSKTAWGSENKRAALDLVRLGRTTDDVIAAYDSAQSRLGEPPRTMRLIADELGRLDSSASKTTQNPNSFRLETAAEKREKHRRAVAAEDHVMAQLIEFELAGMGEPLEGVA